MASRRREPRQERSRATRDAVVEAAARVFADVGLARATMARIADVAGVSPGSMYQYFPNKNALVTALFERLAEEQHDAFVQMVAERGTDDVPGLIRALVEWMIDEIQRNKDLSRVLIEEVPRVSGLGPSRAFDHLAAKSLRPLFDLVGARPEDLDVASVLVVRAFRYSLIGALLDGPLEGAARESFVRELTDLLSAYLLAPRTWHEP